MKISLDNLKQNIYSTLDGIMLDQNYSDSVLKVYTQMYNEKILSIIESFWKQNYKTINVSLKLLFYNIQLFM